MLPIKYANCVTVKVTKTLMLRVYVTGGGCSGFSYGFNFAESQNEDDAEFVNGDVKMLVDSLELSVFSWFSS